MCDIYDKNHKWEVFSLPTAFTSFGDADISPMKNVAPIQWLGPCRAILFAFIPARPKTQWLPEWSNNSVSIKYLYIFVKHKQQDEQQQQQQQWTQLEHGFVIDVGGDV